MKITLLSVGSQFIHGALAPWYLKAALGGSEDITVLETSINEPQEQVLPQIFDTHPEILCVSCYIWNIRYVLPLCRDFKLTCPDCRIILGGPEVSFRAWQIVSENPWVDAVLCGEGEELLPRVVSNFKSLDGIDGVVYRSGDKICGNDLYATVSDLSCIPSPYTEEMLSSLKGRLAYYESSRGCPFNCAYCLSSAMSGVRYFPVERVKSELLLLSEAGVRTVKMVDRTFNAHPARAAELIRFIIEKTGDVCFHLEVGADLFTNEILEILRIAPPGKIRLEAGVQSTNPEVLERVCRKSDFGILRENLKKIISWGNICVHADLIFGLPGEDTESCRKSFNDLFELHPHELQLGFLKLLHGSALKENGNLHGCLFSPDAPYCVIKTDKLSPADIFRLREFEDVFEKFHNSGRFLISLEYLSTFFATPFDLFSGITDYLKDENLTYTKLSPSALYQVLFGFAIKKTRAEKSKLLNAMRMDYLSSVFTGQMADFMKIDGEKDFRDKCFDYLRTADIPSEFPHYSTLSPKAIYKIVRFLPCDGGAYLYDPTLRSPVTGRIPGRKLKFPIT